MKYQSIAWMNLAKPVFPGKRYAYDTRKGQWVEIKKETKS